MTNLPKDYSYSQHRRVLEDGISGHMVLPKRRQKTEGVRRLPVVVNTPVSIIENRRNGRITSITVLDSLGRAQYRLAPDARY